MMTIQDWVYILPPKYLDKIKNQGYATLSFPKFVQVRFASAILFLSFLGAQFNGFRVSSRGPPSPLLLRSQQG
jgi:hypothetical protein